MIGTPHHLPGVAIVVDMTSPGQRLEADAQTALGGRSPSSRKSAAARSMPPSDSGDTLLHTINRSQPSSCIRSNLRSARSNVRERAARSGMPSKSRNGWKVMTLRPKSAISLATSGGVPLYESRSLSRNSTRRNPAAAIALPLFAQVSAQANRGNRRFHGRSVLSLHRLGNRSIARGERAANVACMRLISGSMPTNSRNASAA